MSELVLDSDAKRCAVEIVATLVNVKRIAADLILRECGVPDDLIRRFLTETDATTGQLITKRQGAALILRELSSESTDKELTVVRKLISLAAHWNSFHLASDEYRSRSVVQKALELDGKLNDLDEQARLGRERDEAAATVRRRSRHLEQVRRESSLLLAQFDSLAQSEDRETSGYLLQDLLGRLFTSHKIAVHKSFTRNAGGEQIDGAFEIDSWHYLIECRWRKKLSDIRELDGLSGQLNRSGEQTMGLFLSINGWSENVVPLLKQNKRKDVFLMDGYDLRTVLMNPDFDLRRVIKAKLSALNLKTEPFLSIREII